MEERAGERRGVYRRLSRFERGWWDSRSKMPPLPNPLLRCGGEGIRMRARTRARLTTPSPPSDGGEGRGEEGRLPGLSRFEHGRWLIRVPRCLLSLTLSSAAEERGSECVRAHERA